MRIPATFSAPPATFAAKFDSNELSGKVCTRHDANLVEGVHSDWSHDLTRRVLEHVPELASWDRWYHHPRALSNGHVHTICAAKFRRTPQVEYYRQLLPTPDGGTLAIDLLAGLRQEDARSSGSGVFGALSELTRAARGRGAIAGASESDVDTRFGSSPPPYDPERPMLLLASGLGGGSQDTYVRSMAATAAKRGWQVAVINMRGCGSSPVTSARLFSAYRGANDDIRLAVSHLRRTRLGGGGTLAAIGWSNSGTIVTNCLAEQATSHPGAHHRLDAACALATPLNMPANSANLRRPFHSAVYDANLAKSLQKLWEASKDQYVEADGITARQVPVWDGLRDADGDGADNASMKGAAQHDGTASSPQTFVADVRLIETASTIRDVDEAVTRRQFGYPSVDAYYASASSDQRLPNIAEPLLLVNAYDDPIVPGNSLGTALGHARANPNVLFALTSHGGHLGWCDRGEQPPYGGPAWIERVATSFLEVALCIETVSSEAEGGCDGKPAYPTNAVFEDAT